MCKIKVGLKENGMKHGLYLPNNLKIGKSISRLRKRPKRQWENRQLKLQTSYTNPKVPKMKKNLFIGLLEPRGRERKTRLCSLSIRPICGANTEQLKLFKLIGFT